MGGSPGVPGSVAVRGVVSVDAVCSAGEYVYWVEGRTSGDVLVRSSGSGGWRRFCRPAWRWRRMSMSTAVALTWPPRMPSGSSVPMTSRSGLPPRPGCTRSRRRPSMAKTVMQTPRSSASGLLIAVRERHHHETVTNELVMCPVDGSAAAWPVAQGWDFYSFPRPSPDGRVLAWTSWRHPLMPWDGTWLWMAEIRRDGTLGAARHVAGGPEESVFQPEWSPGGVLHFISDRTGWWSTVALSDRLTRPGPPARSEARDTQFVTVLQGA